MEEEIITRSISKDDFEKAYKFHCHSDGQYSQRINFFLVAESMLVISFVTSLAYPSIPIGVGQGISVIGLIFTSIWLYTNARLWQRIVYSIENYLKKDEIYWNYINSAGGLFSKALLTYALPISMNLLWIDFFCIRSNVNPWIWLILALGSMLIFGIWMDKFHIPKEPEPFPYDDEG